jgi:hypothetical protein
MKRDRLPLDKAREKLFASARRSLMREISEFENRRFGKPRLSKAMSERDKPASFTAPSPIATKNGRNANVQLTVIIRVHVVASTRYCLFSI